MSPAPNTLRVLLLEDARSDAELTLRALAAAGVECSADIADRRARFEALFSAGGYDIVLADYGLPDYTGLEALAYVRNADPLLPFILVTGTLGEERAVEAVRAGANDFVLKGSLARLAPAVRRALEEYREHQRQLEALKAQELSERRYRAIVEDQSELIVRLLPDLTISFANAAVFRFLGRGAAELVGRKLLDLLQAEEREPMRAALAPTGPQDSPRQREKQLLNAAGEPRWIHWVTRGIPDASGEFAEIQAVGHDVTELRRAIDELRGARGRLRSLSRRLLEVQEAERRHLARELHDGLGQALTALKINLEALARQRAGTQFHGRLLDAVEAAREALDRVRQLSLNLRPLQLDDLGLEAALRSHLDRQAALGGLAPHFASTGVPRQLPPEVETVCFRVAQEAINNVLRHAKAAGVWLEITAADGRLALRVRDDGKGFDTAKARRRAAAGESLGVVGMEERMALAGGTLEIQSTPGRGSVVLATFPLPGTG